MKQNLEETTLQFKDRTDIQEIEEGHTLSPKFGADGLIPVVTTDYTTGEVLMLGYMNRAALKKTLLLKEAVYYSRSRKTLWHKGKESGFIQKVKEIRIDDDQDSLWLRVALTGASCHVGYRSCFFRSIPIDPLNLTPNNQITLKFEETEKVFDPTTVYKTPNPTQI
ncbi:phosphoribosyl-AMP cyclohydrolase [Spirochaetota bacterium]|nr:phosphoribosyl-AMP cyclohydrolase [Spirochaetota bacterium]